MIQLDHRKGSGELAPYFKSYGIATTTTILPFGDFSWTGYGPHGMVCVGVERKRITDLIDSIRSKRLSGHQLPGMSNEYDYCYLAVEGLWRCGENGELEIKNGEWSSKYSRGFLYRAVDHYLCTLELKAGLIYRRTSTPKETVAMIVDLYKWWNDKAWNEHTSHDAVYAPSEPARDRKMIFNSREVSLVEKIAMQLPGVDAKARAVAVAFKTMTQLMKADVHDWSDIKYRDKKGNYRRLGGVTAQRIMEVLHGL